MAKTAPKPFVDDYLAAMLTQASQLVSGEFHKVVRRNGFNVSEWRMLASLAGGGTMSLTELAQLSVTKQSTLTRLIQRMEPKGYIERVPHDGDRRVTLVRITSVGQKVVSDLIRKAKEHEAVVLEPLAEGQAAQLKETLRLIIDLHSKRT